MRLFGMIDLYNTDDNAISSFIQRKKCASVCVQDGYHKQPMDDWRISRFLCLYDSRDLRSWYLHLAGAHLCRLGVVGHDNCGRHLLGCFCWNWETDHQKKDDWQNLICLLLPLFFGSFMNKRFMRFHVSTHITSNTKSTETMSMIAHVRLFSRMWVNVCL